MSYYPLYVDLRGRPCLVIGSPGASGAEMDRKAQELVDAGAQVTVITPTPTPYLAAQGERGLMEVKARSYQEGDLAGVFLAIAATTDDLILSQRIAEEAARERTLLNVVDVTYLCTWIAPAVARRGDLTIAISTNGRSPAMARWARGQVERALPQEYGALLDILAEVRQELRRRRLHPQPEAWQEVLDDETLSLLARGDWDAVQARVLDHLTAAAHATAAI